VNELRIHRLSCTTSHDEILLLDKTLLDALPNVMSTVIAFRRHVHTSLDEVVPTENLFAP
jgi:hypothetical protein